MATVTIRLSAQDKQWLSQQAKAKGISLSELLRRRVLPSEDDVADDRLEDHERRLAALEELAQRSY